MADIQIFFFWPALIISIVLSILLTIGLNLRARRRAAGGRIPEEIFPPDKAEEAFAAERRSQTKAGGMILVGPIPIVFGSDGVRFDKSLFKYALAFFLIILVLWFIVWRITRF